MFTTILSLIGKGLISLAYAIVYVYASEIFPTEVRNVGVGTASMCARISSMSSHYVGGPLVRLVAAFDAMKRLFAKI